MFYMFIALSLFSLNYSLSKLHFDEEIAGKVIINLARLTSAKCVFIIINYCTK